MRARNRSFGKLGQSAEQVEISLLPRDREWLVITHRGDELKAPFHLASPLKEAKVDGVYLSVRMLFPERSVTRSQVEYSLACIPGLPSDWHDIELPSALAHLVSTRFQTPLE